MKVTATTLRQGGPVYDTTIRVSATVGRSILHINPSGTVDLGAVRTLGTVMRGSFTIKNKSKLLPLGYRIEAPPGITVSTRSGEITPWSQEEKHVIEFSLTATEFGLKHEIINVVNTHTNETTRVPVRLFVDAGIITADMPLNSGVFEVKMGDVYVLPSDSQQYVKLCIVVI